MAEQLAVKDGRIGGASPDGSPGSSRSPTDERLAHIREHPEMVGLESAIAQVLARPESVVQSASDPQVELYYRYYLGTRVGDKWLCVVVKVQSDDAFVVTAYVTDGPKRGEQIWPQNP